MPSAIKVLMTPPSPTKSMAFAAGAVQSGLEARVNAGAGRAAEGMRDMGSPYDVVATSVASRAVDMGRYDAHLPLI